MLLRLSFKTLLFFGESRVLKGQKFSPTPVRCIYLFILFIYLFYLFIYLKCWKQIVYIQVIFFQTRVCTYI